MIRSLSRPHTATNPEISVCSISWSDNPGQARLLPPNIRTYDRFDVPLRHAAHSPCGWTRTDERHSAHTNIKTTHISMDDSVDDSVGKADARQTRVTAGRGGSLTARTSGIVSRAQLCASCEDRAESVQTPDPPAVSPCSLVSWSSSDVTSGSNSPEADDISLLLTEVTSRLPCIETGQSVMIPWTDIREVFFPRCSAPFCNIVINALKLQLKYPHIPQFMHACSQSEQVTFLKRYLHLVTVGTLLVDVEAFLKHRESLLAMVETKHLVTADTRSIGCVYTQQPHLHQDDWKQWETVDQKQRSNGHLLPAVVTPSNTGTMPGDASSPQEAMVPLSVLPLVFPRYHRQLLLMATGFITGKDKRATRKCSQNEARLLNMWHKNMKGSNSQLVTSGDLLVRWPDVVLIVDPLAKHAARVCNTPQQKQQQQHRQQQGRHHETPIRNNQTPSTSLIGQSLMQENTENQETTNGPKAEISAETWMPKILNCYSTAFTSETSATSALMTESMQLIAKQKLGGHEGSRCQEKRVGSNTTESKAKDSDIAACEKKGSLASPSGWTNNGDDSSLTTQADDGPFFQTDIHCSASDDSLSSSSCDSYCDIAPIAVTVTTGKRIAGEGETPVQKNECGEEKRGIQPTVKPIRTVSEERFESPADLKTVFPQKKCSKPRKCKESGARRSERITNQTRESEGNIQNETDGDKTIVAMHSQETLSAKDGHQTKNPDNEDEIPYSNPSICADSDQSSTKWDERSDGTVCIAKTNNDTADSEETGPCHGFRNIADLFSVLSNEEVSHRSRQLATDEIVDATKKNDTSKTRTLGDLSSKGLDLCSQSEFQLPAQKPQAGCSTKASQQDEHITTVPQNIGKNRNKYPDMLLEAQKCPVQIPKQVPSKHQCNKKQEQVSVTDIMKSMDETFNAFKPDPLELIIAKMRAPENPTGYVNTDYIQITNHREKMDLMKSGSLPPLNRRNSDPLMKKNVKFSTADISAILKCQNQKQKYSILDPKSSSPHQMPVSRKSTSLCVDGTVNEMKPSSIHATRSSSHSPPSKPQWNVKKVIKTQAVPKPLPKHIINDRRKAKMEEDFHAMKTKALAKSETQPVQNQGSKPIVKKSNVNQAKKKGGKTSSSKGKSDSVLTHKSDSETVSSETSTEPSICAEGDIKRATSNNHQVQPGSDTSKGRCTSDNVPTVSEKITQSKKRQRLEDTIERKLQMSAPNESFTSHMTAYWSGFPVGQSKDSLTNYRYGKSRYPIDHYTPPAPVSNRRSKRNLKCNTSTDSSSEAITNTEHVNTGLGVLPSYMNWDRRLYLPFTCVSSPAWTGMAQGLILSDGQQQPYLDTGARERLSHSRPLSADRCQFIVQNNERSLPCVLGVRSFNKDLRQRGNYSSDTSNSHLSSIPCDGDNVISQHVTVPSFYKPTDGYEHVTNQVDEHAIHRLTASEQKNPPFQIIPSAAITRGNNTTNRGVLSVSGGNSCSQKSNRTQDCESDRSGKTSPPVVSRGPFHEIARLEAAGNSHSIRHLGGLSRQTIEKCIRKMDSKDRAPLELPNGEYMIWNEAQKMWFMDKSNNNTCCTVDMIEQSGSIQGDVNTEVYRISPDIQEYCDTVDNDEVYSISPDKQEHCDATDSQEPSVIGETSLADLSDIKDLLSSTVSSFQILRTCLSNVDRGGNTNNNCNEDQLDIKPSKGEVCLTANIDSPCNAKSRPTVNTDFVQPIYPSYGAMIKEEPIRKNILLRETLKNSFFLIQEISKCVCTCRDVVMSSKPGEKMHYKKFFKQQYLESVSHCPLHSGQKYSRQRQEMVSIFEHLSRSEKQKGSECQLGKNKAKRKGNRKKNKKESPGCSWFSERESCDRKSKSVKDKCLMAAAKDYLAAYVNQHYKKELLGRHQSEEVDETEGDHLFTDFFTFIENLPNKVDKGNLSGTPKSGKGTGKNVNSDTCRVADRQLKRQLRGEGSAVTQQELFMQILKKSQTQQMSSTSKEDDIATLGSSGKEVHNGSREEEQHARRNMLYDQSDSTVCAFGVYNANAASRNGSQGEKARIQMGSLNDVSYDEVFSNEHPDVSYHGVAYFSGLTLPYVVDNGYKYLPVKQAARLLPMCCCSIIRSVLKKDSSLNRTLCTWDQVGMLDSLRARKDRAIVRTGDILIRLDTLITSLPALDVELNIRHQQHRRKNSAACLY